MQGRCPLCRPGLVDLACLPHGHRASLALARAGWPAGSEDELRAAVAGGASCRDTELSRMNNVGWVLGNVIRDGLRRTGTGRRSVDRSARDAGTTRRRDQPGAGRGRSG